MQSAGEIKIHLQNLLYELKCIEQCVSNELDKETNSEETIARYLCILIGNCEYVRAATSLIDTDLKAIEEEEKKPRAEEIEVA